MPVSAVLFVKDLNGVGAFYRDALGLRCVHQNDDCWQFHCRGFEFTVHRIPSQLAAGIVTPSPPERRVRASLRLTFPVDNTATARTTARHLGGEIDDTPPPWADASADAFLGHDPEGNVFLIERA